MTKKFDYDVIIIGAGLGGLTTAALLSCWGYKILLLERHSVVGGYSTTFKRNGFEFDASIHWINNIEMIKKVLHALNADDRIEFKPFNPLTRIIFPDNEVMLSFDVEKFKTDLQILFPAEKSAIDRFINEAIHFTVDVNNLVKHTFKAMTLMDFMKFGLKYTFNSFPLIKKYKGFTARYVIDEYFKDPELKAFIHSLGTVPEGSVYPVFCRIGWAAEQNYFYPGHHGGNALVALLETICKENASETLLNTPVKKILIKDKQAYGVLTANDKIYTARYIVSNADALLTYNELIGKEHLDGKFIHKINEKKKYPSFSLVSLGTDYDLLSRGYKGETITYNPVFDLEKLMGADIDSNRKFIHLRSLRDKELAPEGFNTISIGVRFPFNYHNYWETGPGFSRGNAYKEFKESVMEKIIANVSNILPGLQQHIKVKDIATPITYYRYTLNSEGSMMGWEESTGGISRNEPVGNFYRVGHWSFPGGGTPRVLISGLIVAEMLKKRL